jgi:sugar O-acyltransferase (sialic acid O-acetyltransferase NeuD family)
MTARPLLLVGTGGLAREVLALIAAHNERDAAWRVVGLLDDAPDRHGRTVAGLPVLGPPELARDEYPDAAVALCTASPTDRSSRYRLDRRLGLAADRYPPLVHPAAVLARSTVVEPGAVVLAGAVTTADVAIGAHAVVMPACVLTHDDMVGAFATIAAGVRLGGGVRIGTGAYLGAGAAVRERCRVGEWSLVGMGSMVLRDVPARETWWGTPARRQRVEAATGTGQR